MEAARNKAGIEALHFHDLRHEATSRLFENTDLDTMEIKAITGHKSMQMLARYTHLRTDRLVKRLEAAEKTPDASETKPDANETKPKNTIEILPGGVVCIEKPATPAPRLSPKKKKKGFSLKSFLL